MIQLGKRPRKRSQPEVCDFQVIGELKTAPNHLLLLGDDGRCYAMDAASGDIHPLEPDESWSVDSSGPIALRIEVPRDILAS